MTPVDRWNALRDALKLAEQSAPYIDGEQWAVGAVLFMRREVVIALKACAGSAIDDPHHDFRMAARTLSSEHLVVQFAQECRNGQVARAEIVRAIAEDRGLPMKKFTHK